MSKGLRMENSRRERKSLIKRLREREKNKIKMGDREDTQSGRKDERQKDREKEFE